MNLKCLWLWIDICSLFLLLQEGTVAEPQVVHLVCDPCSQRLPPNAFTTTTTSTSARQVHDAPHSTVFPQHVSVCVISVTMQHYSGYGTYTEDPNINLIYTVWTAYFNIRVRVRVGVGVGFI